MGLRAALKKEIVKEIVSCPKPQRVVAHMFPTRVIRESCSACEDEDAGHEILEILSGKACIDVGVAGSPVLGLDGSPPIRARNPLVNDVQFIQNIGNPLPVHAEKRFTCSSGGSTSLKKSSFGSPYGSIPHVRIEGFLSSNPDAHRNVLAFA